MTTNTTLKTRSQKLIEQAGGHCGVLPADEAMGISETWLTCANPARWVGIGKTLNAGECRLMREEERLVKVRVDNLTGATIYKLVQS